MNKGPIPPTSDACNTCHVGGSNQQTWGARENRSEIHRNAVKLFVAQDRREYGWKGVIKCQENGIFCENIGFLSTERAQQALKSLQKNGLLTFLVVARQVFWSSLCAPTFLSSSFDPSLHFRPKRLFKEEKTLKFFFLQKFLINLPSTNNGLHPKSFHSFGCTNKFLWLTTISDDFWDKGNFNVELKQKGSQRKNLR